MSRTRVPKLLSLLYVHNPFYLISACLFVWGLKLLFRVGNADVLFQKYSIAYIEPWGLLGSLAGITILMAVTAILIVRFGKVWEDARSLVLIVLLMLLAISVSMDELINLLARHSELNHLLLMFGLGTSFAVVIGEVLIRGLGIRFPAGYRLPMYGFLILFFAWPALLLREVTFFDEKTTQWLIALFPVVAGLLTLTLIPAIRKGATHVANNGTPWKWPLFPWTPFVFIALAVCFRAYSFSMSFDPIVSTYFWDTTFGLYQLVPFVLGVLVVLLEISIVEKRPRLQLSVLLTGPLLLVAACPWIVPWQRLPAYSTFATAVTTDFLSPVFATAIGLVVTYLWASWRGVRGATGAAMAILGVMAVIGPNAFHHRYGQPRAENLCYWPLLVLAGIAILSGIRQRRSLPAFAGMMLATLVGFQTAVPVQFIERWPLLVAVHLVRASVILAGHVFSDAFAKDLKHFGPTLFVMTTVASIGILVEGHAPVPFIGGYAIAMTILPLVLHSVLHDRNYMIVAGIHLGLGGLLGSGVGVRTFTRTTLPPGVKPIILAVFSFTFAVFISVLKGGLSRRIRLCWVNRRRNATG